jgi:putative ABC transport system permease protein
MIKSIFTFVLRSFTRNLSFSFITISSLVLGITTALLMFMWVNRELHYNHAIPDNERVFALLINSNTEGEIHTEDGTAVPLIDFLSREVPEVEAVTRRRFTRSILSQGETFIQKFGVYGDSAFFKVHTPPHLAGNADKMLVNNNSIVISEKVAMDLFGTQNVLGKTLVMDHKEEYLVTGVFESFPEDTDFDDIQFVRTFPVQSKGEDQWISHYIKLYDASAREAVEKKIDRKLAEVNQNKNDKSLLFAVREWRLYWHFENGKQSGGRIVYVIIFSIASLFVLLISCVNYVNISTARATRRAREIGVRKMTGATQWVLIRQFMTEAFIMTSAAAVASMLLAKLLIPSFNALTGAKLHMNIFDPVLLTALLIVVIVTSFLSGVYPALVLSSFRPAIVLKGNLHSNISGQGFRKGLVVFQFTLSVIMIFCAWVIWEQIDFLLTKDMGYDKHRVINVWLKSPKSNSFDHLRSQVVAHTSIESAGFGGASPMEVNGYADCNRVASPFAKPLPFYGANTDAYILPALNFKFVAGRNFSPDIASDSSNFIITESAAKLLGFDDPIGQRISYNMFGEQQGEIIGVIRDFQNDDIHIAAKPVVFVLGKPQYLRNLFVRYREGKREEAVAHLQRVFENVQPGIPLDYSYLDADFEGQLFQEKLLRNISAAFTFIAMAIACLGLFGLVLFHAQRRTKEIGIRKVLGASVSQVVYLLFRDFLPPVFYAMVIAFPLAYYLVQHFLSEYPTRIDVGATAFLTVSSTVMALAFLTVIYQSLKAARQNAVDSLKTE